MILTFNKIVFEIKHIQIINYNIYKTKLTIPRHTMLLDCLVGKEYKGL